MRGFDVYRPRSVIPTAALALLVSLAATPALAAERYVIDPEHLGVGFLVEHIGYANVLGLFRKAEGEFSFDESSGALGEIRITVDTASVFTNHQKRDEHLKSADFLNSAEFPQMVFHATGGTRDGERGYVIEGELELLGQRHPLTLQATWNKSAEYPFGGGLLSGKPYVMGVSARGSFRRGTYGMNYALDNGWVGDEVQLIIEFEARRQ